MNIKYLFDRWNKAKEQARENNQTVYYCGFYKCKSVETNISVDQLGNEAFYMTLGSFASETKDLPKLKGLSFETERNELIDKDNDVIKISIAGTSELNEAFEAFVATLVVRVANLDEVQKVIDEMFSICNEYKEFFSKGGSSELTPIEEQGLFGELVTLKGMLSHFGDKAIDYWVGQEKNKHDFVFSNNDSIEVKTSTKQNRKIVKISNDMQLSIENNAKLILKLIILEKNPSGQTISDLINEIYENEIHTASQKEKFREKLMLSKVIIGKVEAKNKYIIVGMHNYLVDDSFPKLSIEKIQRISTRIFECEYKIDLDGLNEISGDFYEQLGN